MKGALNLDRASRLLEKLRAEVEAAKTDKSNAYPILDAVRDAYHLREWIWHDHLKGNAALQSAVIGTTGTVADWNKWVATRLPRASLLREICNGSKHFQPTATDTVADSFEGGWNKQRWGQGPWGAEGFYVELTDGSCISMLEVIQEAHDFWNSFFKKNSLP